MINSKNFLTLSLILLGLSIAGFTVFLWAKFGSSVFFEMALNKLSTCF